MDDTAPRIPPLSEPTIPSVSAITDTDAPRGKVVSIVELAALTGYDRGTLSTWVRKGMPVVSGGRHGIEYQIDVRAFLDWREELAKVEALKSAASGTGFAGWMGITKPKDAFAAQLQFMRVAKEGRELVPRAFVIAIISRALNAIRVAVMSIPDRQYREMSGIGQDLKDKLRDEADLTCRGALQSATDMIEKAMASLDDPDDDSA